MNRNKNAYFDILLIFAVFFLSFLLRYHHFNKIHSITGTKQQTKESALFVFFGEELTKDEGIKAKSPKILFGGEEIKYNNIFSLFSLKVLVRIYNLFFNKITGSFESFTLIAGILLFSFVPIIIYLTVLRLTGARWAAFISALVSSFSKMALLRSLGLEFTKEIYSLPFIILSFYFVILSISEDNSKKAKNISIIIAGISAGIALLFWDMTRLYLFITITALTVLYLFKHEKTYSKLAISIILFPVMASFVDPYLTYHSYIVFPLNSVIFVFLSALLLDKCGINKKYIKNIVFLVVLFSCFLLLVQYNNNYSHFTDLLFYKIKFLNKKPLDSVKLPYEARLLWTPALHSVNVLSFIEYYLGLFVIALPGFIFAYKRKNQEVIRYLLIFSSMFFVLSMLFFRLIVFSSFILAVWVGLSVFFISCYKRAWLKYLSIFIIISLLSLEVISFLSDSFISRTYIKEFKDSKDTCSLTDWIDLYTPKTSIFAGNFVITPSILCYGKRSIVTHPKYEDEASRHIIKEYIFSLFDKGEERFYSFCKNNRVDFFVFSKGTYNTRSVNSYRYIAGVKPDDRKRLKSAAFLFERADPNSLKLFGLCYENPKYKVFRVITKDSSIKSKKLFGQALKIFKKDNYNLKGLQILYSSFLYDPKNMFVNMVIHGKQKKFKNRYIVPYVY